MAARSGGDEFGSRDRREHGGGPMRHDEEALARRTERERVEAALEDYDPEEVPPATDVEAVNDPTDAESYRQERAEVNREAEEGELYTLTEEHPFPPTRYDRS